MMYLENIGIRTIVVKATGLLVLGVLVVDRNSQQRLELPGT